ncbi:ABC transporter permease [Conexibacter arvalis]|uniref:Ribose transport system permease protein n=1 Tax=Conexibacter arvalis TaxID=912552 RepID=A0A840I9L6_9ACTN|nr:ABC transporter permease [Conexibacter arvalis]MBB4660620.1 ribose transport system permease protein [Conexibacter arvalis]
MSTDAVVDAPSRTRSRRRAVGPIVERFGLVWALLALIAFFSLWPTTSDSFLTTDNLRTLFANEAVVAIAALGALLPFVAGQFDLTIGAIAMLSSMIVAAIVTETGVPLVAAVPIAVVACAGVGLISGSVVAYLRAPAIVISLGMATLIGGVVLLYSGSRSIIGMPAALTDFGSLTWLGVPRPVWLLLVVVLVVGFVIRYTVTGRSLLMIGSNAEAARLVGVRTRRLILLSFVLAGLFYGVAGVLLLARTGAATPGDGLGLTVGALTAVFLGATTIKPGRFNVPGTIVGVFFVAVSINGLTLAGAADWVDPVFTGAAVVVAVAASTMLAQRRSG